MRWRTALAVLVAGALVAVTVVAFRRLDAGSHSASDTLRPFVLTMAPLWIGALLAGRALVRRG